MSLAYGDTWLYLVTNWMRAQQSIHAHIEPAICMRNAYAFNLCCLRRKAQPWFVPHSRHDACLSSSNNIRHTIASKNNENWIRKSTEEYHSNVCLVHKDSIASSKNVCTTLLYAYCSLITTTQHIRFNHLANNCVFWHASDDNDNHLHLCWTIVEHTIKRAHF